MTFTLKNSADFNAAVRALKALQNARYKLLELHQRNKCREIDYYIEDSVAIERTLSAAVGKFTEQ